MSEADASLLWWRTLGVGIIGVALVALSGGLATEIGAWYRALVKPAFQPPDWLFGPAWTAIFAAVAVAIADAWCAAPPEYRRMLLLALVINGVLNVMWSVLFFKLRRPDWALGEVVLLWLSIVVLMVLVRPWSRRASMLLWPYLTWVSFASILNLAVVVLNRPFT